MKTSKRLTRTLLITGLVLGALWIASPPTGEAVTNETGPGITWELTTAAARETASGRCEEFGALDTCREECDYGMPTGNFSCFTY